MGAAGKTDGGFERERSTVAVSSIMGQVRQDIVSRATPEQLERMRKAEAARGVYRAWNAVCGGTREGEHVTGLGISPIKTSFSSTSTMPCGRKR